MARNRLKLFIFLVISFHLHFCVNYVDSFYTQRQRYASRMLKITPRACTSPTFPDLTGICMISMECHSRGGTVIGACRDGHLFGACCHNLAPSQTPEISPPSSSTSPTTKLTTTKLTTTTTLPTTTTPTTTTTSTTTTTTTTTTEEPPLNNDISSSDASLEADSTAIPSLIDTFSELSPTFLSNLALDEHTTGIYTRGDDLLPVSMHGNSNKNRNQVSDDEDGDNSAPNSASTEGAATHSMMMTSGSSSYEPLPVSSPSSLPPVQDEVGGLAGFPQDPDFKDNMIKYIDEIVTSRSNNEVIPPFGDDIPPTIINDTPDINDIPFSTFTIVSSTKTTESSSPVMWSWSTSGSSNNELSTTTTNPTTSTTETTTTTSTTTPRPPPPPSSTTVLTNPASPSTERIYPPFRRTYPTTTSTERTYPTSRRTYPTSSSTETTYPTSRMTYPTTSSTERTYPTSRRTYPTSSSTERTYPTTSSTERTYPTSARTYSTSSSTERTYPTTSSTERTYPTSRRTYPTTSSTERTYPSTSSTVRTYSPSSSTERVTPSEEILSVSVSQSVNNGETTGPPSSIPPSSPQAPTQFTFSKLKYTPRPYRPRPTTEKVVWTRPPATTPEAFNDIVNIDPEEDDDGSFEDDHEINRDVLLTSPSTTSSSTTEGTTSTEMMMTTSTEGAPSPSPYSYITGTGYDNVGSDDGGYVSDDDIQGHYFGDAETTSTTEEDPSYYYSSSSTSDPQFSSTTGISGLDGINWTSPTILSYLKGTSESFENLVYGNGSRSDLNGMPSSAANEITSPSSLGTSTSGSSTASAYTTGVTGTSGMDNTIGTSPSTAFSSPSTAFSSPSTGMSSYAPSVSPSAPSSSLWDSSIDSFVDQVVEGIVQDLNKSNKIEESIFNNNNKNNKKGSGSQKKKSSNGSTTAASTSKSSKISSSTPAAGVKFTSLKSKLKSALKKSKLKTTSKRPLINSTSTESTVKSTTSKELLKLKAKVPTAVTKTRITKNKAKPIKKVTTAKSPNSTRKRLNFKRDCGVRPLMKRGRIVGGTPSRFGSWPWHALVKETVWWGIFSKIKCGGVLIGPQHVLTAAHCQPQQTGTLSVVLGITDSDDTDSRAITKTVRRTIPHPQFNPRTYENDIAILELESPVDFQPHIVPICLPRDEDELEGKTAYVTGMGLLKHDGERPLVLQEVDLPILNNTECQKMFKRSGNKKPIIESFICAGYEQGRKDSCGGDSGGPLSVKRPNGQWVLAGTVSHGIKCALPDQPGVYMRTSYYKPWIDRVLSVARSRYRGIPRCNAPPLICARQRHHQNQVRQQQGHSETGVVNTLFRIFRLARKMVEDARSSG